MPRTSVVTQPLPAAGLLPVHSAVTALGDVVDVGRNILSVINGGSGPCTVTVQTPGVVDGDLAVADRTVTVPVGTVPTLIPLASPNYRQPSSAGADAGRVYVDYAPITAVTRAVVSL